MSGMSYTPLRFFANGLYYFFKNGNVLTPGSSAALSLLSPWRSLLTVGVKNCKAGDNKSDDSNISLLFVF